MSDSKNGFSVGDYIIDFENIYQIYEKKDQTDSAGKTIPYFFYKPIEVDTHNNATYATPIENILKSGLRHLISSNTTKKLHQELEEKIDFSTPLDYKSVKEILYQNDPSKNILILKQLFLEKEKSQDAFSRTNREILESILNHLSNEIAFVSEKPVDKVKEKIISLVQKSVK